MITRGLQVPSPMLVHSQHCSLSLYIYIERDIDIDMFTYRYIYTLYICRLYRLGSAPSLTCGLGGGIRRTQSRIEVLTIYIGRLR